MDKQARKLTAPREDGAPSEAGSEGGGSNEESDHDDKVQYSNVPFSSLFLMFLWRACCFYFLDRHGVFFDWS